MHYYSCRQRCQMAQSIAEAFLAQRQLNDFLQQNGFASFDSFVQEYQRLKDGVRDDSGLSKQELAIISAFTGCILVPDGKFSEFHEICEEILGIPVYMQAFENDSLHQVLRDMLMPEVKRIINAAWGVEADGGAEKDEGGKANG